METVGPPAADAELNLLTQWGDPASGTRTRRAAVTSVAIHLAIILLIALLPPELIAPAPAQTNHQFTRRVTPLTDPSTESTQKRPNAGELTKELDVATLQPRVRVVTPQAAPSTTRPAGPRPAV